MSTYEKCKVNRCSNAIKKLVSHPLMIFLVIILISIICIFFIIYRLEESPNSIYFKKLSEGEVIANILVFIPTTITWLVNNLSTKKERKRMELREEYLKWLDDFTSENSTSNSNIIFIIKLDGLLKENEKYNFIKYDSLFTIIQKNLIISDANNNLKKWMDINHKLIESIDVNVIKNIITDNSINTLKAINFDEYNFDKIPNWTEKDYPFIFKYCKIKTDIISYLHQNVSSYRFTFEKCIFDKSPREIIKDLNKQKDLNITIEISEYYVKIGGNKYIYHEENDNEKINNKDKDKTIYYDLRNFGEDFSINKYLYKEKSFDIELDNNKNVNTEIIEKLNNSLNEEASEPNTWKDLNLNKTNNIISKSKSYIPTNLQNNGYKLHSWNVLKGNQVNENVECIIFTVKKDSKVFECLIFTKEKFNELYRDLYEFNEKFSDERYYFYYANKKS